MPIAFQVAAKEAETEPEADVVEVPIEGKVYLARRPTPGHAALLASAQLGTESEMMAAVFQLVKALLGAEALRHIQNLLWEDRIELSDVVGGSEMNPDGLIGAIFNEFASDERPTKPSSASASTQARGGRKSTGRSPGRGSTLSS